MKNYGNLANLIKCAVEKHLIDTDDYNANILSLEISLEVINGVAHVELIKVSGEQPVFFPNEIEDKEGGEE